VKGQARLGWEGTPGGSAQNTPRRAARLAPPFSLPFHPPLCVRVLPSLLSAPLKQLGLGGEATATGTRGGQPRGRREGAGRAGAPAEEV
jgi:hypothetical protein